MGASFSGGHSSHPEHNARFIRVTDAPPSPCRMCHLTVELGRPAYRCSEPTGCAVVLHEACYRRPRTLKRHLGHPQHRLTLAGDTRAGVSCSLCARPLGTPPVAYSCNNARCGGFHAHPRCCDLPSRLRAPPELHKHADLVLRPPLPSGNGGERRRRRCMECKKVATVAPWSYQCSKCVDVEYCLACLLGDKDDDDLVVAAVQCIGHLAGEFFCAFLGGMGCPRIHGGIKLTKNRKGSKTKS